MLFRPFQVLAVKRFDPHSFLQAAPRCGILYIPEGSGSLRLKGVGHDFSPGDCFYVPSHSAVSELHCAEPVSLVWIGLKIYHIDLYHFFENSGLYIRCDFQFRDAVVFSYAGQGDFADDGIQLAVEHLLMSAASVQNRFPHQDAGLGGMEKEENPDDVFQRLQTYLAQNLQNEFSIPQLARENGYTPRRLNLYMQRHYGCSTLEFINRYRLQKAKEALLRTDKSITEIAYRCGYNSIHYFSRLFKKVEGCSPKSYRNGGHKDTLV